MKVQVGDTVHVRGTVQKVDTDDTVRVLFAQMENAFWVGNSDIVHAGPPAIKVGDRVCIKGGANGIVAALDGDSAWIKLGEGDHETWTLEYLTRIESEEHATR